HHFAFAFRLPRARPAAARSRIHHSDHRPRFRGYPRSHRVTAPRFYALVTTPQSYTRPDTHLTRMMLRTSFAAVLLFFVSPVKADDAPQVSFLDAGHSTVLLNVDGKQYVVDVAARSIRDAATIASQTTASQAPSQARSPAADLF